MCSIYAKEENTDEDNSIEVVAILNKNQGRKVLQNMSLSLGCIHSASQIPGYNKDQKIKVLILSFFVLYQKMRAN